MLNHSLTLRMVTYCNGLPMLDQLVMDRYIPELCETLTEGGRWGPHIHPHHCKGGHGQVAKQEVLYRHLLVGPKPRYRWLGHFFLKRT